MLNSVNVAAMIFMSWTLPAIETMAHEDEEVICFYIDAWIRKQKLKKTLVDSGIVIVLISRKMVPDLDFFMH